MGNRFLTHFLNVESLFSILVLIYVLCVVIPTTGGNIRNKCYASQQCKRLLSMSEMGYSSDLSDSQWREFRGNIILLFLCLIGISLGRRLACKIGVIGSQYHLLVGLVFLIVQHKYYALVVLLIVSIAYLLVQRLKYYKICPIIIWIYALSILLLKESYRIRFVSLFGFQLSDFFKHLFNQSYSGLLPWHVSANFLVLRLISFSMDFYWATTSQLTKEVDHNDKTASQSSLEADGEGGGDGSTHTRPMREYCLANFVSYCLYCPLYIGGPVITFNAYMHYSHHPQTKESVAVYALRWIFAFFLLEIATHYFPFFAVMKSGLFAKLSTGEVAVLCYVTLKMMWIKFLVIWRLFRLWAMCDGVLPPENMTRCMSNNYHLEGFWKGWHSSFNLWIVRYLYLPLGGRKTKAYTVWAVFFFVAIWHDIEWKLVAWGLLNACFFVAEIIGKWATHTQFWQALPPLIQKIIKIFSASSYVMVLMGLNMVGYAVGTGGVGVILRRLFLSEEGLKTVLMVYCVLGSVVPLMFTIEQYKISSKSQIDKNCKM